MSFVPGTESKNGQTFRINLNLIGVETADFIFILSFHILLYKCLNILFVVISSVPSLNYAHILAKFHAIMIIKQKHKQEIMVKLVFSPTYQFLCWNSGELDRNKMLHTWYRVPDSWFLLLLLLFFYFCEFEWNGKSSIQTFMTHNWLLKSERLFI